MKSVTIIISFLVSFFANAQVTISNLSLTDTTQNIFYIGVDNLVRISGKKYKPLEQSVTIRGGNARMSPAGLGLFIIQVESETDSCQMWINEKGKRIFEKNFVCRKIGNFVVRYGGLKDSIMSSDRPVKATVDQLLENSFLYIDFPGSYYKHNYQILSFTTYMLSDKTDSLGVTGDGNRLWNKQKEMIKKLQTGDAIIFDDIYCLDADNRKRKLVPFIIEIK